jgi:hypothetical protein
MAQGSSGAAAIRVLLDELHAELLAAPPELDEPKTLEDIMWNLERLGLRNSSASARGAAAAALDATSLDQLEVLLEVDADWHPADGKWSVHEVQRSLAGEAGAAHLNTLRETAAAAVTTERSLTYLVQLLRDPAYELVGLPRKLQQLTKLIVVEMLREQRTALRGEQGATSARWAGDALPADVAWVPYVSAVDAHHQGPIDHGAWSLTTGGLPEGINVSTQASCKLAAAGATDQLQLQRAVCVAVGKSSESLRQAVAFAVDAHACIRHMRRPILKVLLYARE